MPRRQPGAERLVHRFHDRSPTTQAPKAVGFGVWAAGLAPQDIGTEAGAQDWEASMGTSGLSVETETRGRTAEEVPGHQGLRRVVGLAALYGPAYRWDGKCSCGSNRWQTEFWEGGFSGTCAQCGEWVCHHEPGGVIHTSDGLWFGRGRAKPPAGCPKLTECPWTPLDRGVGAASRQDVPGSSAGGNPDYQTPV